MMHTYVRTNSEWTVGYWQPNTYDDDTPHSKWVALEDFTDEEDARRLVNYLNGGTGNPFPYKKG